jgi:hypothetical protein
MSVRDICVKYVTTTAERATKCDGKAEFVCDDLILTHGEDYPMLEPIDHPARLGHGPSLADKPIIPPRLWAALEARCKNSRESAT